MSQAGTAFGVLNVSDCAVYNVTADAAGGITYGSKVDVPAIRRIAWRANFADVKRLKGDGGKVYDSFAEIESYTLTLEFQSIPLSVLSILLGGTVTETTTSNSSSEVLALNNGATPGTFKIEAIGTRVKDFTGGGTSAKLVAAKVRVISMDDLSWEEGDYATGRVTVETQDVVASGVNEFEIGNYEASQSVSA